jgi:UDP-glucose 4-epimerase
MADKKRALVTGGAGFIGSHLVDRLVEEGFSVLVVDDLSTGREENISKEAEFERLDITDSRLVNVFQGWRPKIVFHFAAQVNLRRSLEDPIFDTRVNALGTLKVLECCRQAGSEKIVFSSTGGAIYGEPQNIPCDESHPTAPLSLYGANKRTAEHYLDVYRLCYGLRTTTLRFANVYGPRQDPHGEAGVVAIFSELMLAGKQPVVFGDGTKTRDYVFVSDLIEACVLAVEGGDGRVFNVGCAVETSDQEVFDTVAAVCRYQDRPRYDQVRPGEVYRIALDFSLIAKELGWKPATGFRAGVELTVPFYRRKLGLA